MKTPNDWYYILVDRRPVLIHDILKWSDWMENEDRRVNLTAFVTEAKELVTVSTVFLGMDQSLSDGTEPILFETMVFGGRMDYYRERYCTWDEAGHDAICEKIKSNQYAE